MDDPRTFSQFWPGYVRAHASPLNRKLHFVGTTAALACVAAAAVTRKRWLLALAPVVGYGPAWFGHFVVEGNRPATFGHPLWSLAADFVMWGKTLAGTMDAEVERCVGARDAGPTVTAPPHGGAVN